MIAAVVIVLAVILIVVGISRKGGKVAREKGPIKIGFIGPLTGEGAVYGEPGRNMVQMAVDEINAQDGIDGKQIEVIYEDGKCGGPASASAAQKLVNVDKVQAILGGFCSSESLAAEPITTQGKVFLLSLGSSSPDLTNKSLYFARTYPSDATQGKVLAEISYNNKGWRKVAFIQEQLDYPLGVFKAFDSNFSALGGTTVKEEFPQGATDFRTSLLKLREAKPDALFIDTQTPASADRVFKQVGELKWKVPILVADATSGDPTTVSNNAAFLEGALAAEFGIDPNNQKFQTMLTAYKNKYGGEPPFQSYAQTEYDGVYMLRDAIKEVGYNGEKLATWFRTVKDWPGASGLITIGDDGDRDGGHVAKIIKNGKVEILDVSTLTPETKEEAKPEEKKTEEKPSKTKSE